MYDGWVTEFEREGIQGRLWHSRHTLPSGTDRRRLAFRAPARKFNGTHIHCPGTRITCGNPNRLAPTFLRSVTSGPPPR